MVKDGLMVTAQDGLMVTAHDGLMVISGLMVIAMVRAGVRVRVRHYILRSPLSLGLGSGSGLGPALNKFPYP